MKLDSHGKPTTKICRCGRELGRTTQYCSGCGHVFRWQRWEGRVAMPVVAEVAPDDFTDHELLLAKLRTIGKPEVLKWEALADRYALYRAEYPS